MTRHDLSERLASWAEATPDAVTSGLLREASEEVERLRHRVRFTDNVIRSGNVATLTDAEREALEAGVVVMAGTSDRRVAEALRGLLDRL